MDKILVNIVFPRSIVYLPSHAERTEAMFPLLFGSIQGLVCLAVERRAETGEQPAAQTDSKDGRDMHVGWSECL